jgi:Flp pilus assembly pilin Flp
LLKAAKADGQEHGDRGAVMKALLLRFWKDRSGSTLLSETLFISGISLTVIPSVQKVGIKLNAVFTKILQAFP